MNDKSITPLISVITATFNSQRFILDIYKSLQAQSYKNWEWVVTDDASEDKTVSILKELQSNDDRIKIFINADNKGAAWSRNNSMKESKGQYFAFIDSDDLWHPEKLSRQIAFMGDNIDFSFTSYELVDVENKKLNKKIDITPILPLTYHQMLRKKATLGCSTVILRVSAFPDVRMPDLRTGQDYATWLKILKRGTRAYLLPEVLTSYRIVNGSISRNKFKKALRQWEIYRKYENLSFLYSCYCFSLYAFRAVVR
ncbi:glycosyltransferase [Escherichia coli]|nr:glycosyltransferase [Escherichia coli]